MQGQARLLQDEKVSISIHGGKKCEPASSNGQFRMNHCRRTTDAEHMQYDVEMQVVEADMEVRLSYICIQDIYKRASLHVVYFIFLANTNTLHVFLDLRNETLHKLLIPRV